MAVAGGITSAYRFRLVAGSVKVEPTSYPKAECAGVEDAIAALARGEAPVVASADVPALRERLRAVNHA